MIVRALRPEEKGIYNSVVEHPLQTWEWGDFRTETGIDVERIGFFQQNKLQHALQVTFHPLPVIGKTAGYLPRGYMPDEEQLAAIKQLGKQHNALFIKLEPNVAQPVGTPSAHNQVAQFLQENDARAGRALFTKYTFQLDLNKSEDELFEQLDSKTRYNVRLASKKGVQIFENSTKEGMEQYIDVLQETTKRQGFYAHTPEYFRKMWQVLGESGMIKIFNAVYEGKVLTVWIMFVLNGILYYPYGSSRTEGREVMPNNLMMWEMIRYGKQLGCHTFDMWGSLGPEPNPKDPWFGFHKFKKGYGGILMEFVGTYDLVIDPPLYQLFRLAEEARWFYLRLRTKLPF